MQHDSAIKVTIRTPTSTRPAVSRQNSATFSGTNPSLDWLTPLLTLPMVLESLFTGLTIGSETESFNPNVKLAFENSRLPTDREKDEKCSICQDAYGEKPIVSLPTCLHNFHKNCIEQAVKYNRNCPICRTSIPVLES